MLLSNTTPKPNRVPSVGEERFRAKRVWILVDVMFLTWAFFYCYLWARGYETAVVISQIQVCCYVVIQLLMRKKKQFLVTMNLYLICSGMGVFFVAVSHPDLARTLFFYHISILVASYLFGIRQATYWFLATLFVFTLYYGYVFGISQTVAMHFDEFVISLGTVFCAYFCSHHAEATYKSQTRDLLKFSRDLQSRSEELELLATTDSLTRLTNRYQFQNELEAYVSHATEQDKVALFMIDMDGFKEINDTLGHAVGDEVLVKIGERLTAKFGDHANVARLGGDEFCILFSQIPGMKKVDKLAVEIVEVLTARYHLSEVSVTLGTSVGYAICPDHAQTGKHILSFADTAMYHAKQNKQNVARYQSEMTDRISADRLMNELLSIAIEDEEFYLNYQPQFDSNSDRMIGVEALMRWKHDGQPVSPARFIPLLENTGRIVEVSKWLLREACRQQAQWKQQGIDLVIAVNISALQFEDDDFVDSVILPLKEFGVAPEKIELEITEGILVDNVQQVSEKLRQLNNLGCRISIDDFGTGYSSLAYLRQFPLDKLKIDRAFVKEIPATDDGVIASGVIMLAKLLELEVIAEGVETLEQVNFLRENGCTQCQGFYFSKPVSAEQIVSMIRKNVPAPGVDNPGMLPLNLNQLN